MRPPFCKASPTQGHWTCSPSCPVLNRPWTDFSLGWGPVMGFFAIASNLTDMPPLWGGGSGGSVLLGYRHFAPTGLGIWGSQYSGKGKLLVGGSACGLNPHPASVLRDGWFAGWGPGTIILRRGEPPASVWRDGWFCLWIELAAPF